MFVGVFGSITWDVLLLCALSYPQTPDENNRTNMLQFINGLVRVLPCDGCSAHAIDYVTTHPPDLSSSDALVEYIVIFHNIVNRNTGRRAYTTFEAKKALFYRYFADEAEMSRALIIRQEDHATITKLQKTIAEQTIMIELQQKTIAGQSQVQMINEQAIYTDLENKLLLKTIINMLNK
jgi:hypothetical protein